MEGEADGWMGGWIVGWVDSKWVGRWAGVLQSCEIPIVFPHILTYQ